MMVRLSACAPIPSFSPGLDGLRVRADAMRHPPLALGPASRPLADHHVPVSIPTGQRPAQTLPAAQGVEAGIVEITLHRGQPLGVLAGRTQPRHFAGGDDALARAQRQLRARTGRLAEAAFDAEVDNRVGQRHQFQVFDMNPWRSR